MGSLFSKPKAPVIQEAPKIAKKTDKEIGVAAEADKQKRKLQKGRASTILGGSDAGVVGDDSAAPSAGLATKTLMGGN